MSFVVVVLSKDTQNIIPIISVFWYKRLFTSNTKKCRILTKSIFWSGSKSAELIKGKRRWRKKKSLSLSPVAYSICHQSGVSAPDSLLKGCKFESWQKQRENFFSRVNFVCWLLFGVHSTPGPRSFCQKCTWKITAKHTYTLDPTKSEWADNVAVQD